jgi:hypothetical protein
VVRNLDVITSTVSIDTGLLRTSSPYPPQLSSFPQGYWLLGEIFLGNKALGGRLEA